MSEDARQQGVGGKAGEMVFFKLLLCAALVAAAITSFSIGVDAVNKFKLEECTGAGLCMLTSVYALSILARILWPGK